MSDDYDPTALTPGVGNYDLAAAAAAAAAAAQAAIDAANRPLKRKKQEPAAVPSAAQTSAAAPHSSGMHAAPPAPAQHVSSAAYAAPSQQTLAAAYAARSPAAPVAVVVSPDSFLHAIPASLQSALQSEVLSLIFPGKNNHAPHLYKNLPGPQPISMTRSSLTGLAQHNYYACEKSDGERAMIFISRERQATFIIDRKFAIRQVKHPAYAEMWATQGDSLFDGELVLFDPAHSHGVTPAPGQPLATFMAFDVLILNGVRMMERKLSERLMAIGNGIVGPYRKRFPPTAAAAQAPQPPPPPEPTPLTFAQMMAQEEETGKRMPSPTPLVASASASSSSSSSATAATPAPHPLAFQGKAFWPKRHLEERIMSHIRSLGGHEYEYNDGKRRNKNDGVIFTPEDDDYWCRSVPLLKWKHQGLNTIDFLTRAPWFDGDGKLMLYSTANAMPERVGQRPETVTVHMRSTLLTPEKRTWFLSQVAGKDLAIAEMQYDPRTSSWQPKNFRWDKSTPNFMTTVVSTLETIVDNVQPADLYAACGCAPRGGGGKKSNGAASQHAPHQPLQQQPPSPHSLRVAPPASSLSVAPSSPPSSSFSFANTPSLYTSSGASTSMAMSAFETIAAAKPQPMTRVGFGAAAAAEPFVSPFE